MSYQSDDVMLNHLMADLMTAKTFIIRRGNVVQSDTGYVATVLQVSYIGDRSNTQILDCVLCNSEKQANKWLTKRIAA